MLNQACSRKLAKLRLPPPDPEDNQTFPVIWYSIELFSCYLSWLFVRQVYGLHFPQLKIDGSHTSSHPIQCGKTSPRISRMQSCNYRTIYDLAATRKGGEENLELLIRQNLPNPNLGSLPEDRFLAEFTRKVFQSGFVWRVVDNKWPAFEELFWGFDVDKLLMMPDEMLERKATDPAIIRNLKKVWSIRENALMIRDVRDREGSFGQFIADWPEVNIIGLWQFLKAHGSRLGGNVGPYALRFLGKDTFLLSRDVEAFLREREIIEGGLTSKRSLTSIQNFFNELQQQSNRSLCELSRMIAFCVGDNRVVVNTEENKEAEPA